MPFVAGASTDSCARVIAQVLETRWGVPVKVINKPGGNTVPAVAESLAVHRGVVESIISGDTDAATRFAEAHRQRIVKQF